MATTLDFYSQTRISLPDQMGRATLKNVLEAADAVGCIEITIRHIAQAEGPALNKTCEDSLNEFGIHKLTLARAKHILSLWKKWTWPYAANIGQLPKLSDCTQFLYDLKRNK
jgi:hypothetical protein